MNTPRRPHGSWHQKLPWAFAAGLFCLNHQLPAQTAEPPAATDETEEETIILSPFVVETTEESDSYTAQDTLAGSRVRTEIKDLPSSISVITSQFLKDTGAKNTQDLLVYTTNTEVGGVVGNYSGAGGGATYNESTNLLRPNQNTRVRGLDSADNTRDFFLTEIPWDSYNVDRVDMQRGPNSILFGLGSPAGIINNGLTRAKYKNDFKFENRVGSFGSIRNSIDANVVIVPDTLALRVAALDDNTKYRQEPSFNDDQRLYATLRWDPKLFGENSSTSVRVNFETGSVDANRPRSLPPIDGISPWFYTGTSNGIANLDKLTLNPLTTWTQYAENPALYPNRIHPWLAQMGRFFSSNVANFYNAGSSVPLTTRSPNIGTPLGINDAGVVDGTIAGVPFSRTWGIVSYNAYARQAVPGGKFYKNYSLSDSSIFDFYNLLMDGNNKREWQDWTAANFAVEQNFFSGKLGFELVYDMQRYEDGQYAFLGGDQYILSVDLNTHYMDGTPNPNVGRPYVSNSAQYGNNEDYIDRDVVRFTTTGILEADDFLEKSWLTDILGRHVFTGLLVNDVKKTDYRDFARWASSVAYSDAAAGVGGTNDDITNGARQIDWVAYLGPSLSSASSPAGAHLSNVSASIHPGTQATTRFFDSRWRHPLDPAAPGYVDPATPGYTYITYDVNGAPVTNTGIAADNPANYVGWRSGTFDILSAENGDLADLYTAGQKSKLEIESVGLTWQGYFFEDTVVPIFGWREDTVKNASSFAPKNAQDVSLMDYDVDTSDANTRTVKGQSTSWGIVVHTPRRIRDWMPAGTSLSLFYNSSENFKADVPRGDVFGNQIPNPYAKTEDYGVTISTLNDRIQLKVTKYKTTNENATLANDSAGFGGSLYYAWALPYWGATHALAALDGISDPQLRQGNWGWPWNGIEGGDPVRIRAVVEDFFRNFPLDQNFVDEYGLGMNVAAMRAATTDAQRYASVPTYGLNNGVYDPVAGAGASGLGLQPAYAGNLRSFGTGPTASVDTTSEASKLELHARVTNNWNFVLNASKTTAEYSAVSPTIQSWIETYTEFLAGDAGLINLWGGDPIRKVWADNILAPYSVLQAQIGNSAPEIAPWRFNVVTDYSFNNGLFKGTNVGISYRWEDGKILGYEYDETRDVLDIDRPLYGDAEDHVDFWVGYERKLTDRVKWRVQLNVRNAFENPHLVPVSMQPDGSVALARIQEGTTWHLTNTFSF